MGIIAARTDSTRLPAKVLAQINGLPLIGYVIKRANRISDLKGLVLATTDRIVDDQLAEYAAFHGLSVYRGELDDVALRLLNCAKKYEADYFLRLNGDSPFLDPELIKEGIGYCKDGQADIITNLIDRTFPYGISVEIVKTIAFERAYKNMSFEQREHVTQYLYENPDQFVFRTLRSSYPELSQARLVVDTEKDMELFKRIAEHLGDSILDLGYRQAAELFIKI